MEIVDQEKVWDKIAGKWAEFKTKPSPIAEKFLKDKKGKILDLGSGSGRNFPAFDGGTEIYAQDFSKKMLGFARKRAKKFGLRIEAIHSPSDKIPLEEEFFDFAICIAVLHCVPGKRARQKIIEELFRVLKPGGRALVSVWGRGSLRLKNKPKETFVPWTVDGKKIKRYTYIYDFDELKDELIGVGFKIVRGGEERNINFVVEKV
jgi:tRNA (uracil-5-)-methyltransferase TRM9